MPELHPSISAVGAHFDSELETEMFAPHPHQEDGMPADRPAGYRPRDTKSSVAGRQEFLPADTDLQVEEMMHLDQ